MSQMFKWLGGIVAALIVSGTAPFWWKYIVGSPPQPSAPLPPAGVGQGGRDFRDTKGEVYAHRNPDGSVTVLAPKDDPNAPRRHAPAVVPDQNGMVPPPSKQ